MKRSVLDQSERNTKRENGRTRGEQIENPARTGADRRPERNTAEKPPFKEKKQTLAIRLVRLAAAVVCLILGVLPALQPWGKYVFHILAFLILGYDVLWKTVYRLLSRSVLNPYFLLSVAGLGTMAIGRTAEAVLVLLLFQLSELLQIEVTRRVKKVAASRISPVPGNVMLADGVGSRRIPAGQVVPGDVLRVAPGEWLAVDGVVEDGASQVDTSALTGGETAHTVRRGDAVISGSRNLSEPLTVRATADAKSSAYGRAQALFAGAEAAKGRTQRLEKRFTRLFVPIMLCLAFLMGVVMPILFKLSFTTWFYRGMMLLIVACPVSVAFAAPAAYVSGIGAAVRRGVFPRSAHVMDKLSRAQSVVLDKTGIVTTGEYTVTDVVPQGGTSREALLSMAAYGEARSAHPIARAILNEAKTTVDPARIRRFHEERGQGVITELEGQTVICVGSRSFMEKLGVPVYEKLASGTAVYVSAGRTLLGCICLSDATQSAAAESIKYFNGAGIHRVILLTGDNRGAAERAARDARISEVYPEYTPEGKLKKLQSLSETQRKGETLAYVGDGVSDIPLLAAADVGVVLNGVRKSSLPDAADVVVMDGDLSKVADTVVLARQIDKLIVQNNVLVCAVKALLVLLAVTGTMSIWAAMLVEIGLILLTAINALSADGERHLTK